MCCTFLSCMHAWGGWWSLVWLVGCRSCGWLVEWTGSVGGCSLARVVGWLVDPTLLSPRHDHGLHTTIDAAASGPHRGARPQGG